MAADHVTLFRYALTLVLSGALTLLSTPAAAQGVADCPAGQTPRFVFGFANLKAQIGEAMGEPLTCEFSDPNGTGDVHQRTSTGLAFWRKSTNTPTFTNGFEHWGNTPTGLVSWTGSAIDPPNAYPAAVVADFMRGCTAVDPSVGSTCQCTIDYIQAHYSLADFERFILRYLGDGMLPVEVTQAVLDCVLQGQ